MDCRESRELMTGAVDNELSQNEAKGFFEHIEICASCREEYEIEKLTKAYIRRKITFVDVPYDLEGAILAQISAEAADEPKPGFFTQLLSNRMFQPVMAVGAMLVIAVALFFANRSNLIVPISPNESVESIQAPGPDVLTMAMNNFQNVLNGKFSPQITATRITDISTFLNQNAGYAVSLPAVPNADWIGGSVTKADGSKLTHVIYKIGEGYIYIFSFPRRAVALKHVSLPPCCAAAIEKKEWYWGLDRNGDTQAVWSHDDHVSVVTANLQKKDLINYLRTSYRTGP